MKVARNINRYIDHKNRVSNLKAAMIYIVTSLFLILEMAIQVSPSVMSNGLMRDLNISTFGLGVMSGFYFYAYAGMQIPAGLLLDKYSPRIIITLSILICSLGSLIFAISNDIYLASIARLLMGLGSAFAFISVLVVTADLFESKYFPAITGVTQMLAALGAMTGQLPVGILVSTVGWREAMSIIASIGIILAILIWNFLNYKRKKIITNSCSKTKLSLSRIIAKSQTWYIAIYACLLWAPMSGFASLWGVPFLSKVHHLKPPSAAFLCSFMWLGLALASPLLGVISGFIKNKIFLLSFTALIGSLSFFLILEFTLSKLALGILLFLAGASCSGQALSFALIKESNPISIKATVIAFNNMAVVISGAIFQPIIGKLIDSDSNQGISISNYKYALSLILFAYLFALLISIFFIKNSEQKTYKRFSLRNDQCGEIA